MLLRDSSGIFAPPGLLQQFQEGRHVVRFYLVAMLFVVFDLELVFLYPWAIHYAQQDVFSQRLFLFGEMAVFVGILLVAYVYAFKKRVFDWNRGE